MLKDELTKKVHVLKDIDQLLSALNKIDMQIQTEVGRHIHEEGNQNINHLKQLENEIISLRNAYRIQKEEQTPQTDKEHSYHLTLSY
ncbi:hypothetical protein V7147_08880 [Bacillus sp. JJ1521]|uniref:hypothetical protein n=1 Tax=Bacillus sp. JJ1521 TaxID=3122957 RepID=UPI002FFEF8AA